MKDCYVFYIDDGKVKICISHNEEDLTEIKREFGRVFFTMADAKEFLQGKPEVKQRKSEYTLEELDILQKAQAILIEFTEEDREIAREMAEEQESIEVKQAKFARMMNGEPIRTYTIVNILNGNEVFSSCNFDIIRKKFNRLRKEYEENGYGFYYVIDVEIDYGNGDLDADLIDGANVLDKVTYNNRMGCWEIKERR